MKSTPMVVGTICSQIWGSLKKKNKFSKCDSLYVLWICFTFFHV